MFFFSFPQRRLKIDPAGRPVAYVLVRRLVRLQGPSRRLQEVRLFLRAFVLYSPWITGEHCQGASAVECVAAHLRGFEEDSRSEVVFWIEEWSIEVWLSLLHRRGTTVLLSALQHDLRCPTLHRADCCSETRSVNRVEAWLQSNSGLISIAIFRLTSYRPWFPGRTLLKDFSSQALLECVCSTSVTG